MDRRDCSFCALDAVDLSRVPECALLSVTEAWKDIVEHRMDPIAALTLNDRIVYIIGILIVAMLLRLLV